MIPLKYVTKSSSKKFCHGNEIGLETAGIKRLNVGPIPYLFMENKVSH